MLDAIVDRFRALAPRVAFWSIRAVRETACGLTVRRGVVEPPWSSHDLGVMITVGDRGGVGYAATADLTAAGLTRAIDAARTWAHRTCATSLIDPLWLDGPPVVAEWSSPVEEPWAAWPLPTKLDLLRSLEATLRSDARIVNAYASLWRTEIESRLCTSTGTDVHQTIDVLVPMLSATANQGSDSQTRTLGGHAMGRQGGLEILEDIGFLSAPPRIVDEALALLAAPNCPSGTMDLVLAPDQMILQIHESIGHPLELDRILGDERNYAGRSFVTPEMFGTYQYGSALLNVTFDPTVAGQLATYAVDDDGTRAEKAALIRDGLLVRGLGGALSQRRSGLPGVANARADGWQRPPIDRMANLNLEPGDQTLEQLIAATDDGVWMETNVSWSIDDSRNKFQFGCELGRRIEHGRLGGIVKKPNYRGVSATFWRSLAGVGCADTLEVLGTPFCGKGEPNQIMRVGHAAPPCRFTGVEVFGGA